MELTDPPEAWSYDLGGTNHSFEASSKICSECHGAFDGGTLRDTVDAQLKELEKLIASALMNPSTLSEQHLSISGSGGVLKR